jgi:hypothetical protein
MPEPECILELRRRLSRHGLPWQQLERIVREAAEHWEDSRMAALEEGLEESEAAARADRLLGEPVALAKSFTKRLRHQSWLGRYPLSAVLFLPTLLVLFAFCLFALPITVFEGFLDFSKQASSQTPGALRLIVWLAWLMYGLGTMFAPVTLSWWAWRSGLGRRFVLLLCASCALATSFRFLHVDLVGRVVAFGVRWPNLSWQTGVLLVLHFVVAVAFLALSRTTGRALPLRSDPEPIQTHET